MPQMSWSVSVAASDRKTLSIGMLEDGKQIGHVAMTAVEAESLINLLISMRAQMIPEVDSKPAPDKLSSGRQDPLFAVADLPVLPGKAIAIRHEGIGWLSFYFRDEEAEKLANALLDRGKRPTSDPVQTRH